MVKSWWVHANNAHELEPGDVLPVGCVRVVAASDYDASEFRNDSLETELDAVVAERDRARATLDHERRVRVAEHEEIVAKILSDARNVTEAGLRLKAENAKLRAELDAFTATFDGMVQDVRKLLAVVEAAKAIPRYEMGDGYDYIKADALDATLRKAK